jgi:aminopeptidase N
VAHQWVGDDVALSRWSDIWLNEGFASYAESLYSEASGGDTAQEIFDRGYDRDANSSFWRGIVDDPGPAAIFDGFVYERGAMTLHALRAEVGDAVFFEILRGWAQGNAGGNVTTAQFEAYASQMSGQDLSALFDTWLRSGDKPADRPVVGP